MRIVSRTLLTLLFWGPAIGPAQAPAPHPVEMQMRNVNLHLNPSVVLEVRRLRGQMVATSASRPPTLDDVASFIAHIDSAEIAVSPKVMSDLLNQHVFAYPGAPLKQLVLTIERGKLKQRGVMHKGIDLPFEAEGTLAVTSDGQLRFHPDKVRSAHLPFKGLLHLFGEDLSKLLKVQGDRGVTLQGDDILLDLSRMLPPPRIEGRVTAVRLEGDRIVQTFGSKDAKPLVPPSQARNYIYYRGGVLRFGKLTMVDTDLQIVDQTPADPFDFSVPDYDRQLVAGYSRNTPAHGLIVTMPDFSKLPRRRPAPARSSQTEGPFSVFSAPPSPPAVTPIEMPRRIPTPRTPSAPSGAGHATLHPVKKKEAPRSPTLAAGKPSNAESPIGDIAVFFRSFDAKKELCPLPTEPASSDADRNAAPNSDSSDTAPIALRDVWYRK